MPVRAELHHISLEIRDTTATQWFYDRFLGQLGFDRFATEATYLAYTDGTLTFWLMRPHNPRIRREQPNPEDEVVPEHLAFRVGTRDEVSRIEQELQKQGVYPLFRAEEHPEFRPGYFSASWVDPDQMVLEVYTTPTGKRRAKRTGRSKKSKGPATRSRPGKRTKR
jgi:catechol 2,3-dioxygenase-like lactoylglutathione lyase family enzyme